ncbi:MAG: AsmA family protein [Kiloniellaceae bacterium]|nr:AsmA family protein [Kiloniellaceae bacterium]
MKKVAVALAVLIVVVVAALLVAPSFWDWNREKGRMAALVKEHTGRDLQIVGDVSLRLLPTPAFSAREVTLANLDGGSDPAMVRLEELQVSIGLLPLLRGEIQVKSVTLVKPEVLLEVLEDGRANWQLAEAAPAAAAAPGGELRSGATSAAQPIRIDSFLIEDGRLRYRDARSGREELVSGLNAELAAASLVGPFAADGAAVYGGVPVEFDFNLGQLVEGGATAVSLSLQLPQAGASGTFIGALSRHEALRTLRGRLQAEGADLARVVAALPLGAGAPGALAQPFTLTAEVSASNTEARAEAVRVTLGPLSLDGRLAARLEGEPDITASFSAKTVDLDALLALPARAMREGEGNGSTPRPAGTAAPPSATGSAAAGALPRGFSVGVELAADALLYRGQTLRQLQVAARLEDGRVDLTKATLQLPGSSDLAVIGTLSDGAQGARFEGTVAAESDNLRGLLQWLGVDVAVVPAERLRRMALNTEFEAAADQMVLRNADLRLDVSRLTGGAAIALRERPGLGLALNIDKINLDAYLPQQDAAASVPTPSPSQDPAGPQEQAPPAVAPPGLPLLGRFDANLDLRVGQLTYRGLPFEGLRLDATLQQGGIVVREASVADLVGSRGQFSGSLANVDRDPSIDGSLDVSVSTLSRLVKALGLSTGGSLPLESFTLSGAVNGNREMLRFDQRLAALGGSLHAAGKLQLPAGAPTVAAALEFDHPDLTILLRELLSDPGMPAGLGAAAVKGRVAAGGTEVALSGLEGRLAGVELLAGDLAFSLSGPRPKITADLTTGEMPLAALTAPAAKGASSGNTRSVGPATAPERWSRKRLDLGALRVVDAEVKLSAKAIRADKLRLTNAALEAQLADGVLELRRFTADSYGGALSVTGKADARDAAAGLQVDAEVTASNVELKSLLRDLADTERFSGPMTLQSRLTTQGASQAALIGALGGDGTLTGTVTAAAKVEEQAGALVLDILGKKVKEIRGVTDSTTVLFGAFAGAPAKVSGSFVVEKGVAQTNDLKVRGRDATALTKGSVDLPDWLLDSTTDVVRDADPDNAYLTARLRGPLDEPNVAIGGQPFQRSPQPPAEESGGGQPPTAKDEPQHKPTKPEEILKDGLKNLLKGLGG